MTNNFTAQSDGFDRNLRQLINLSNGTVATIFDRVYAKKETFQCSVLTKKYRPIQQQFKIE